MIEQNLQFARAVLNWATVVGDGSGGALLERNPLAGLPLPKEKNPNRVILTEDEYQAMLAVASGVDWRFHAALVLAHETGHRIGAIRQLRWSDIDMDGAQISWPAPTEKTGYEHVTPLTEAARKALELARQHNPGIGDAPVFPALQNAAESVPRDLMYKRWKRAERLAGLEPKRGPGWHSLRRKFASDLIDEPLKVLADLGGWKSTQTIVECYQRPDQDRLKQALATRRKTAQ